MKKIRIHKLLSITAFVPLLLTGCGSGNGVAPVTQYSSCPQGKCPTNPIGNLPAAVSQAILGTYTTTLNSIDSFTSSSGGSQPATIVLNTANIATTPGSFANITLTSTGSVGNIQFSGPATMMLQGVATQGASGAETAYGFATSSQVISGLSSYAVTLEFVVVLTAANQFDPALSSIVILDDGFSQGIAGGTADPFAAFGSMVKH